MGIANLTARTQPQHPGQLLIEFNSCWPQKGTTYTLLKGKADGQYTKVGTLMSATDSTVAFQFSQPAAKAAGATYRILSQRGSRIIQSGALQLDRDLHPVRQLGPDPSWSTGKINY